MIDRANSIHKSSKVSVKSALAIGLSALMLAALMLAGCASTASTSSASSSSSSSAATAEQPEKATDIMETPAQYESEDSRKEAESEEGRAGSTVKPDDDSLDELEYVFEIPEYWVDKVDWKIREDGQTVFFPVDYPQIEMLTLSVYKAGWPHTAGDIGHGTLYASDDETAPTVALSYTNWSYIAGEDAWMISNGQAATDDFTPAQLELLVDLTTGGKYTYDEMAIAYQDSISEQGDPADMLVATRTYLEEVVLPTLSMK